MDSLKGLISNKTSINLNSVGRTIHKNLLKVYSSRFLEAPKDRAELYDGAKDSQLIEAIEHNKERLLSLADLMSVFAEDEKISTNQDDMIEDLQKIGYLKPLDRLPAKSMDAVRKKGSGDDQTDNHFSVERLQTVRKGSEELNDSQVSSPSLEAARKSDNEGGNTPQRSPVVGSAARKKEGNDRKPFQPSPKLLKKDTEDGNACQQTPKSDKDKQREQNQLTKRMSTLRMYLD